MSHFYLLYIPKFNAYKPGIARSREKVEDRFYSLKKNHHWPDMEVIKKIKVPMSHYEEMKKKDNELKEKFADKRGTVYIDKPVLKCVFKNKTKTHNAPTKKANGGTEIFDLNKNDVDYIVNFLEDFEKEFLK